MKCPQNILHKTQIVLAQLFSLSSLGTERGKMLRVLEESRSTFKIWDRIYQMCTQSLKTSFRPMVTWTLVWAADPISIICSGVLFRAYCYIVAGSKSWSCFRLEWGDSKNDGFIVLTYSVRDNKVIQKYGSILYSDKIGQFQKSKTVKLL